MKTMLFNLKLKIYPKKYHTALVLRHLVDSGAYNPSSKSPRKNCMEYLVGKAVEIPFSVRLEALEQLQEYHQAIKDKHPGRTLLKKSGEPFSFKKAARLSAYVYRNWRKFYVYESRN